MTIDDWGRDWGVSAAALDDLRTRLGHDGRFATQHVKRPEEGATEGHVLTKVQCEAGFKDTLLFRNNVGVLRDENGRPVRYGLANESKEENSRLKSSDLIGIRKVFIEPYMLGRTIGQFVAREAKHGAWVWGEDSSREVPQQTFGDVILSYGGDFAFASGVGTFDRVIPLR